MSTSSIERRESPRLAKLLRPDPFNIEYKVALALQPRDGPLWTDVRLNNDVRIQTTPDNQYVEILLTFKGKGIIERTLSAPDVRYLAAVVNPASDPEEVLKLMAATQDPISFIPPERAKKGLALFLELVSKSNSLKGRELRRKYENQLLITEDDGTTTVALPLNEREFDLTIGLAAAVTRFLRP